MTHDGLLEALAEAAAEEVAAAARHDVDDAAREAAVLGRDAVRQDARLLDRILDEEVVRRALDVVVDVDAVHHEHVVEAEAAGHRQLARVRGVGRDARRQLADVERPAADGQRVNLGLRVAPG